MGAFRGLIAVGGLLVAGVASSQAAVNVYYVNAQVGSLWGAEIGETVQDGFGPAESATHGSQENPSFLVDPFVFNHLSSISGLANVIGSNGIAYGEGLLNASVNSNSFSAAGRGYAETVFDPTGQADLIFASGGSRLSFNFRVPAEATNLFLMVNGTASARDGGELLVRISEMSTSTDLINVADDLFDPVSYSWTNELFPLIPDSYYAVDLYGNASDGVVWANALETNWSAEGQFNLNIIVVPEPSILLTGVAASVLLIRRRRSPRAI